MTKRKGFTLIELLIVLFIIGVLSSMMSITTSNSTDTAKAVSIIGNLSTIKKTALALYMESEDVANATTADRILAGIAEYMTTKLESIKENKYNILIDTSNNNNWYVSYKTKDDNNKDIINTNVQKILEDRAKSLGLLGGDASFNEQSPFYTKGKTLIGLRIR